MDHVCRNLTKTKTLRGARVYQCTDCSRLWAVRDVLPHGTVVCPIKAVQKSPPDPKARQERKLNVLGEFNKKVSAMVAETGREDFAQIHRAINIIYANDNSPHIGFISKLIIGRIGDKKEIIRFDYYRTSLAIHRF